MKTKQGAKVSIMSEEFLNEEELESTEEVVEEVRMVSIAARSHSAEAVEMVDCVVSIDRNGEYLCKAEDGKFWKFPSGVDLDEAVENFNSKQRS